MKSLGPTACVLLAAASFGGALLDEGQADAKPHRCPAHMVSVLGRFCIDAFEASTVEVLPGGKTRPHSPFQPVTGLDVKAVSRRGVKPQAYISDLEAEAACARAGKRLCTGDEWKTACKGKHPTLWPYGDDHEDGRCNDAGTSSFNQVYGQGGEPPKDAYTWANMNDPRLNQLAGTLAPTGAFKRCKNGFGAYDMVGNLHEWTKGSAFRGGYYLDTHINGEGCDYVTTAHAPSYHDYSTGFRCCK
ncbi:MAG TPA: SUMF1/EgtB/PvdO family nonheme iron enzyme [Minicystis sp.]|nr:SUMF1/EgtB/PvdO family nonheme iron enzyme [Minicystis sp.]